MLHSIKPQILLWFQTYPIGKSYCGEAGMNNPIDSSLQTAALAAYTVDEPLTAIAIKHTSDGQHTIALLGTRNGKLLKVGFSVHLLISKTFCWKLVMNLDSVDGNVQVCVDLQ